MAVAYYGLSLLICYYNEPYFGHQISYGIFIDRVVLFIEILFYLNFLFLNLYYLCYTKRDWWVSWFANNRSWERNNFELYLASCTAKAGIKIILLVNNYAGIYILYINISKRLRIILDVEIVFNILLLPVLYRYWIILHVGIDIYLFFKRFLENHIDHYISYRYLYPHYRFLICLYLRWKPFVLSTKLFFQIEK